MRKYNITGDGIIIGDGNVQNIHKTISTVDKDLVALIQKLATDKADLFEDLEVVQNQNETEEQKQASGSRIARWLKTVAGEAGKVMLRRMMDSGIEWAQGIAVLAER